MNGFVFIFIRVVIVIVPLSGFEVWKSLGCNWNQNTPAHCIKCNSIWFVSLAAKINCFSFEILYFLLLPMECLHWIIPDDLSTFHATWLSRSLTHTWYVRARTRSWRGAGKLWSKFIKHKFMLIPYVVVSSSSRKIMEMRSHTRMCCVRC